ncbi:hypothetical protein D3C86_2039060 [compost metagenome]
MPITKRFSVAATSYCASIRSLAFLLPFTKSVISIPFAECSAIAASTAGLILYVTTSVGLIASIEAIASASSFCTP